MSIGDRVRKLARLISAARNDVVPEANAIPAADQHHSQIAQIVAQIAHRINPDLDPRTLCKSPDRGEEIG